MALHSRAISRGRGGHLPANDLRDVRLGVELTEHGELRKPALLARVFEGLEDDRLVLRVPDVPAVGTLPEELRLGDGLADRHDPRPHQARDALLARGELHELPRQLAVGAVRVDPQPHADALAAVAVLQALRQERHVPPELRMVAKHDPARRVASVLHGDHFVEERRVGQVLRAGRDLVAEDLVAKKRQSCDAFRAVDEARPPVGADELPAGHVNVRQPLQPPGRGHARAPADRPPGFVVLGELLRRGEVVVVVPVLARQLDAGGLEPVHVVVQQRDVVEVRQHQQPALARARVDERRVEVVEVDLRPVAPDQRRQVEEVLPPAVQPKRVRADHVGQLPGHLADLAGLAAAAGTHDHLHVRDRSLEPGDEFPPGGRLLGEHVLPLEADQPLAGVLLLERRAVAEVHQDSHQRRKHGRLNVERVHVPAHPVSHLLKPHGLPLSPVPAGCDQYGRTPKASATSRRRNPSARSVTWPLALHLRCEFAYIRSNPPGWHERLCVPFRHRESQRGSSKTV